MFRTDRVYKVLVSLLLILGVILAVYNKLTWEDSVKNPDNDEFVAEVAFNLGIEKHEVTQAQFNRRYKE